MNRTLTANQIISTRPDISASVTANAGAGKTFVLTARVLRLLLKGVAPSKILCLTYTKAAAAEMNERVKSQLQAWALMDEATLRKQLKELIEVEPSFDQIKIAKKLFSRTLESMPPPRIQTIHSFCQEVLKRFPLESDVQPYFEVIDDITANDLIKETTQRLLSKKLKNPNISAAIDYIASEVSETKFNSIVGEIISNRNRIRTLFDKVESPEQLIEIIFAKHKVEEIDFIGEFMEFEAVKRETLQHLIDVFRGSTTVTDQKMFETLSQAVTNNDYYKYCEVFLTKEFEPRTQRSLISKKSLEAFRYGWEWIEREQQIIMQVQNQINLLSDLAFTKAVIYLAHGLISIYEQFKNNRSVLDYNDLTYFTRRLLTSVSTTSWVLYKLDGGIEHILVDEAQDTSPEQWDIILALVDEFLSGQGANARDRTIFIVGDEKQSIYSFQGADPKALKTVTDYVKDRCNKAGKAFSDLTLDTSFRSTEAVLQAVDTTFEPESYKNAITSERAVSHVLRRIGEGGKVEIWPLVENEEKAELENWQLPLSYHSARTGEWLLAEKIADNIKTWVDSGKAQARDILILLKSRGEMADILIRKLKKKNINVSGSDRLKITEHIAIQDLIALGNFLLLPSDDLSLASVLKSPIFNISEEQLFELCYNRVDESVWSRIQATNPELTKQLSTLLSKVDYITVYELYSYVLDHMQGRKKIVSRLGGEVNDVIDEFLDLCITFELGHVNSIQQFISWICVSEMEIKRDMENINNEIRIMTVHGSKGLEAPIVILADAAKLPNSKQQLYWDDEFFYAFKTKSQTSTFIRTLIDRAEELDYNEYLRLLYVGMTRARDELYIAGSLGEQERAIEKTWYNIAKTALTKIGQTDSDTGIITYTSAETVNKAKKPEIEATRRAELPEFIYKKLMDTEPA